MPPTTAKIPIYLPVNRIIEGEITIYDDCLVEIQFKDSLNGVSTLESLITDGLLVGFHCSYIAAIAESHQLSIPGFKE